ncbi:MAG: peptidylprolyl isomerase [Gemmatimonadetes bacterium]|nr:peptidylprolyl isomerase [Gemmatimonadota bacterium]
MAQAKKGDVVHVHYTGRLQDGTVFDSSQQRDPLQFQVGAGQVIPGFESAVEGMEEGETRTATIEALNAYGPRNEDMMLTVPREQLPDGLEPEVGASLQVSTTEGQVYPVRIAELQEQTVVLDANHPLAGKALTFELTLAKIAA